MQAWQREGLNPPETVLNYTAEFIAESDSFALWLDQNCDVTSPKAKVTNDELYVNWKSFCENGRGEPGTHNDFMAKLKSAGFKDCKIGKDAKRGKLGIGLKQEEWILERETVANDPDVHDKKPCSSVGGFDEELKGALRKTNMLTEAEIQGATA